MTDENAGSGSEDAGHPEDAGDRPDVNPSAGTTEIEGDDYWEQLLSDVSASAEEHRRAGYQVVLLHPEASGTVTAEEPGIAVVVPPEEFDDLDRTVSARELKRFEVFRGEVPGRLHLFVQLYTTDADAAVLLPAAVDRDALVDLRGAVGDSLHLHVTPEGDDATLTFRLDDPSLFFPEEGGDIADADDPERNGADG